MSELDVQEARSKVINEMASPDNINIKSDLDGVEVYSMAYSLSIAKKTKSVFLDNWNQSYLELKVSLNRKSREEFKEMVKPPKEEENSKEVGVLRKAFRKLF